MSGVARHEAQAACAAALKHRPYDARLLTGDATALLRLGRYRAAIRAYDGALRLAPSFGWALYGRGVCELRLGQLRRGSLDLRSAKIDSSRVADRFAHDGLSAPGTPAAEVGT